MVDNNVVSVANSNADQFTKNFLNWLPNNMHVYKEFEEMARRIHRRGFKRYSSKTIMHVMRYHSDIAEVKGDGFKISNNHSPYLSRLFDLVNPECAGMFAYHDTPSVRYDKVVG